MTIEQLRRAWTDDEDAFSGPLQTSIVKRPTAVVPSSWAAYHASLGELLGSFDTVGYWRMDLETGMLFWSTATFRIFGFAPHDGPVDFTAAMQRFHPEDRNLFLELIEEATEVHSRFETVLRLTDASGRSKFVRCLGTFQATPQPEGGERRELIGILSEVAERVRSVRILE